jgi:polyisoprenoid-binding protein YceI
MKTLLTLAAVIALAAAGVAGAEPKAPSKNPADAPAGVYVMDKKHSNLSASLLHMGLSHYTMRFDAVEATYTFDPAAPEASQVQATIDANSLDVGDPKISAQFAKEFLAADANPTITFVSTSIHRDGDHGEMMGNLTLRGVTKPVVLHVTFNGTSPGMMPGMSHRMGFSAWAEIKRSDFGSTAWLNAIGDDIHITFDAEFSRK